MKCVRNIVRDSNFYSKSQLLFTKKIIYKTSAARRIIDDQHWIIIEQNVSNSSYTIVSNFAT